MNAGDSHRDRRRFCVTMLIVPLALVGPGGNAIAADPAGAFPISYCHYRVPYSIDATAGEYVKVNSQNVLQLGHGGFDLTGRPRIPWDEMGPPLGYPLVAVADGWVRRIVDSNTGCCKGCQDCNNQLWIEHDRGEFTAYYHIAPGSATVSVGDPVQQGDVIAFEGDVGSTSTCPDKGICPSNSRPNAGCNGDMGAPCCSNPLVDPCPCCSVHLHFRLHFGHDGSPFNTLEPDQFTGHRIPFVCSINENHFEPSEQYSDGSDNGVVENCILNNCFIDLAPTGMTDTAEVDIEQASNTITTSNWVIEPPSFGNACTSDDACTLPQFCDNVIARCRTSGGSALFRAGSVITLLPGFHAKRGSYFRGEIGPCNSECN